MVSFWGLVELSSGLVGLSSILVGSNCFVEIPKAHWVCLHRRQEYVDMQNVNTLAGKLGLI